jgi:kumamolisin
MNRNLIGTLCLSLVAAPLLSAQTVAVHQFQLEGAHRAGGQVIVPTASIERPEDQGIRSHTHFLLFVPSPPTQEDIARAAEKSKPNQYPDSPDYYNGETPASLACVYGLVAWTPGCLPYNLTTVSTLGSKAIALVDAYHYPTAMNDLTKYSAEFGLPAPTSSTFQVVFASGTQPDPDPNCATSNGNGWNCWEAEEAIDIEMAHAMAPNATIYLVEAASNKNSDLYPAVKAAVSLLTKNSGGGEISMSWGASEYSKETTHDSVFTGANVVLFASTGDHNGTQYPSTSPNVVAVGGTTLSRSPATLDIEDEISWLDGGGGESFYEKAPSYQSSLGYPNRVVPDISAIADPRTPIWVYDSFDTPTGANAYLQLPSGALDDWMLFGGTSVASPLWAGVVNAAGHFAASTAAEEKVLYSNGYDSPSVHDIVYGSCGYYQGWYAGFGWDPCTGLGSPYGTNGK